jgi:hypothetical protein
MRLSDAKSTKDYVDTFPCEYSASETANLSEETSIATGKSEVSTFYKVYLHCLIRPLSLCLIGLAVAVVLWGFAYKLSLYEPANKHSTQICVAKMWLGPEQHAGILSTSGSMDRLYPGMTPPFELAIGAVPSLSRWQELPAFAEATFLPACSHFVVAARPPPSRMRLMHCQVAG